MGLRIATPLLALTCALAQAPAWAQAGSPETAELNRLLDETQARKAAWRAEQTDVVAQVAARVGEDADWATLAAALSEALPVTPSSEIDNPAPYAFGAEAIEAFLDIGPPRGVEDLPRLHAFDMDLREALSREASLDKAVNALAPRFALDRAALADFIRLWIEAETFATVYGEADRTGQVRWQEEFLAFARAHGDLPLVLEAAAVVVGGLDKCESGFPARLLEGREDPVSAWRVASAAECRETTTSFAAAHPDRALGALITFAHYGWVELPGQLPLSAWLVQDDVLARVAPGDRLDVAVALYRRHLDNLLDAGLAGEAVAFADGLPPATLEQVLDPAERKRFVTLDGLPFLLSNEHEGDGDRADLAIAFALVGRQDTARALMETGGELARERAIFACWTSAREGAADTCPREFDRSGALLMLGHLLDTPAADPYPLAEAFLSGNGSPGSDGVDVDLRCRVFAEPRFGDICKSARRSAAYRLAVEDYERADHEAVMAILRAMDLPGFAALEAHYAALVEARQSIVGMPDMTGFARPSIDPVYPDYGERLLPAGVSAHSPSQDEDRLETPPAWPEGWAKPDPGFWPVRWEQQGSLAVFVSVSPFFNPSGEISQGGYWVHLSEDGGRSWAAPMFTGLAQYWPYVVAPRSQLPMLTETGVQLEVAIAELDTASITYPPVGLVTRREATGLVIDVPFARLRADADGDGLTDIAEAHLLLDQEGDERPFVLGSGGGEQCPATPDRDRLARAAVMGRLFDTEARAIVEPVNRRSEAIEFGGWTGKGESLAPPLFVEGDPADLACIEVARPVLVYSARQIGELQRRSPDFRTIELPQGVWNADRTRGYVEWSAGWVGGTLLLEWNGSDWDVTEISSWIT
jgi:hypothetical protein